MFDDVARFALSLFVDRDIELAAELFELFDGGRAVDVRGHQQGTVAAVPHVDGDLGRRRGFARALKADEHDDRGWLGRALYARRLAAQEVDQLLIDNVDDLLRGIDRADDFVAEATRLDRLDEVARDPVVDVRLEQGEADLTQGLIEVLLGQGAAAAELAEDAA